MSDKRQEAGRVDHLLRIAQRLKREGDPRWERAQKLADLHSYGRPVVLGRASGVSLDVRVEPSVVRQEYRSRTTELPFYTVVENREQNRLQIAFENAVPAVVKTLLKASGFRRNPTENVWQRSLGKGGSDAVLALDGKIRRAIELALVKQKRGKGAETGIAAEDSMESDKGRER